MLQTKQTLYYIHSTSPTSPLHIWVSVYYICTVYISAAHCPLAHCTLGYQYTMNVQFIYPHCGLEWDSYVQSAWYSSYPVGLCFSGPIRCQNTFQNWFRTTRNGVPLFFPHQCSYSDRKGFPLGENHPYGPEGLLECPWSEILPSVTLTKRYDLIWNSGGGVQTPHGTRIWCEKSFNGSKSGFFHFCWLFWHNGTLILVYKSMSNANLELWPHMESPWWL